MTNLAGNIKKRVGNIYGLRTWIEYGFKQIKNELGWADYRLTDYAAIERWWEVVSSAYVMVSLQAEGLAAQSAQAEEQKPVGERAKEVERFKEHKWWDGKKGWKNLLNNLRLVIQPYIFCLISPWLEVFDSEPLREGFRHLIGIMNLFSTLSP